MFDPARLRAGNGTCEHVAARQRMLQFSIKHLFVLTAGVALGVFAVEHPSPSIAAIIQGALLAVAAANLVLSFRTQDIVAAAGHLGAAVSIGASCLVSMGFHAPPQLYLCGPPLGVMAFFTAPGLWEVATALAAAPMGVFGYFVASSLRATNAAGENVAHFKSKLLWGASTIAAVALAAGLIHLRSSVVATSAQIATNTTFIFAVIAALYRQRGKRVFWIAVAATLWIYLFLGTVVRWPYSYYFGPASYLYRYYYSISSSWVTAHCLFAILLAAYMGLIAQWVVRTLKVRLRGSRLSTDASNHK